MSKNKGCESTNKNYSIIVLETNQDSRYVRKIECV